MISHTYKFHLDSDVIRLPNLDDLLGKEVEVVIREIGPGAERSNFDAINQLLLEQASPAFFSQIKDPVACKNKFGMSGSKLLLDSNIAVYLSQRALSVSDFAQPGDVLFVSLVTYMEVVGFKFSNESEELFINGLFTVLQRLPVTQSIADRVITYRKARKIKLPDAIIMSTAREYDCQLVTRNVSDFVGFDDELIIINPFDR